MPLEPLEERYTAQMYKWVIDGFQRCDVPYTVVAGEPLTKGITHGEVLDAVGTNYYKAIQLQKLCQLFHDDKVSDGDIFFIADLWFPGIEMLRYMESQLGLSIVIAGVHYAGVFDPNDFTHKMRQWARHNEMGWLTLADYVFVGSRYHKELLQGWTGLSHIYDTGLVWDHKSIQSNVTKKEQVIIFPHRIDKEKNPQIFFDLVEEVQKRRAVEGIVTTSRQRLASNIPGFTFPAHIVAKTGLTKQEYYDELARAKVLFSSADQETFGYALNEGLALGCIPICPAKLSYVDVLVNDRRLLYQTFNEAVQKVIRALDMTETFLSYTARYSENIDKMLDIMGA